MTLTAILVLVALLSYLSIKVDFILLKIAGMAMWFVLFMYIKSYPPTPLVEGSPAQQLLLIVCVATGIGIALMSFGRNASRNNKTSGYSNTDWKWKFGKDKEEVEGRNIRHNEPIDEYQTKVRHVLGRDK